MRVIGSLFAVALFSSGLGWVGCSSDADPPAASPGAGTDAGKSDAKPASEADATTTTPSDLKDYRIVGRYDETDPAGPKFDWSGTQIIAKFSGDTISVDLADTMTGGDDGANQFDVTIDDKPQAVLTIDSKEKKTYPLGSGLGAGAHTLVLTRRTEAFLGVTQLLGINATLVGTPPPPARRIEMVGDSITAGYGVLGPDKDCHFSAGTENEAVAWGALTATALNATHTAIAWSGIGVYISNDGSTDEQMPALYQRALATVATSQWTPSNYEPDVVVVALGTNDLDEENHGDPGDEYQKALTTFAASIRAAHANAPIVFAMSPMLEGDKQTEQKNAMQAAIDARKAAGDAKLSLLEIPTQDEDGDGLGCDYHPNKVTQQKMSTALVAHLKPLLGW